MFAGTSYQHAPAMAIPPITQFLDDNVILDASTIKEVPLHSSLLKASVDTKSSDISSPTVGTKRNRSASIQDSTVPLKNAKRAKRRRHVRWEEDEETQDVKLRIVNLPHLPSQQMSKCEKVELWMQKHDYEQTLSEALIDVAAAKTSALPPVDADGNLIQSDRNEDGSSNLPIGSFYTEAMAQTYSLCCSPDAQSSIALENVALLSLLDSSYRGLESHTLPRDMRVDRKVRKAKTVSRVLELQGELRVAGNPDEDATECLRLVSEFFSEPSRKFARALGEIDGTFVHLES